MPRLSKIGAAALAAFGWTSGAAAVTVDFLVIAGGGGSGGGLAGNYAGGGGGGAGGYRCSVTGESSGGGASAEGKLSLSLTESYTVIVGGGGTGVAATVETGGNGSNSTFSTITSVGGGGSGSSNNTDPSPGAVGGSGGGAAGRGPSSGGLGTANQGFRGGNSAVNDSGAPGGGGSGSAGVDFVSGSNGTNGGNGVSSSITGSAVSRAGGGGGGGVSGGTGQAGGGNGATSNNNGPNGTANTGGGAGGGGASISNATSGGNGGSGIVIISYVGAQQFGGGVVTVSGGNTIHTFTTSGTLSPLNSLTASCLVVAGGGGGGKRVAGAGGAGGYRTGSGITIDTNSIYAITVGAGGAGSGDWNTAGTSGSNSVFNAITSAGGGGGAGSGIANGVNGGSGGGSSNAGTAGSGNTPSTSPSQGNNGGVGSGTAPNYGGGGGGGANATTGVGGSGTSTVAGNGGAGTASSISGSSVTYAGGGGGGSNGGTAGTGGSGGGGAGTNSDTTATAGTANLGGGGGGCGGLSTSSGTTFGGSGGSGVVIISYPGTSQQMAGGTVTVAGGNVIHTFTSSGYLAPIFTANNSLRFRGSATAFLNRTPSVAGNRKTWTWSGWVKRGNLTQANGSAIFNQGGVSSNYTLARFDSSDRLDFQSYGASSYNFQKVSTAVYRDPSAWYHIVFVLDATNTQARIFVNGTEITAFSTNTNPANADQPFNQAALNRIGYTTDNVAPFDGYMTEINFIDGLALTPNSFGTFNGLGVWQPIRYGGSYGTNGFYLPFNSGTSSFAGSFNGSNQYLTVAQNAAFNMGSGDFTIESWVYFNTSGRAAILSQTNSTGQTSSTSFYLERNASNFLRIIVGSGGTGYEVIGATVVPSGQWIHVAGVRNGNNLSCYLNGVSQGTVDVTGVSINSATDNVQINGYGTSTALVFAGGMSNVRIVKGTAVYTSNFTPPTSNLTAISGTSLLTLQNATIVDNSGNSFTITNNNSVTTGQTYPFAYNTFNDQSPQGNNWTPNNFSGASGSTLDYMTDVPTLTSATAANYCVINPIASAVADTYSQANLRWTKVVNTTNTTSVGSIAISSGKWYWEGTVAAHIGSNITIGIGNTDTSFVNLDSNLGMTGSTTSYAYNGLGLKQNNNSQPSYGATFTTNDVIGVAFDADAGTLTFYKNNTSQGTAYTGITGTYYPACGGRLSNDSWYMNFGQRPFSYTPPTGFVALNTFNLPTPTIGATASTTANKYMDATLYTGNSSTQTVTNSGSMQPDWVWIKDRSVTSQHVLTDSVRGVDRQLFSSLTNAEQTSATAITSFNSNGFTTGANPSPTGATNSSPDAFVAWQWRASNATAVTNTNGSIISTVSANTTAGFSILTYTGNATSSSTVGHGLGVTPTFIIIKKRSASDTWNVYSVAGGVTGNTILQLNTGDAPVTGSNINITANSTTIGFGSASQVNGSGATFVCYAFAPVAGYSQFGSYVGNGSTDGPFIFTGFRPRFIMTKNITTGGYWWEMVDSARSPYNTSNVTLYANVSDSEYTSSTYNKDLVSNGFKIRGTSAAQNSSGDTFIYMAFAESPFKYANAR